MRPYNHACIAWIKAYLLCLGEGRQVTLIHVQNRQLELFN